MSKNTKTEAPKEKKNGGYRWVAFLFFAACVATLFLPIGTFTSAWVVEKKTLIETVQALLASNTKMFGILPAFVDPAKGTVALGANFALYLFALCMVLAIIIAFVAIWSKKNAPRRLRTAVFFFTLGSMIYTLSIVCVSIFVDTAEVAYDLTTIAFAAAGAIIAFILMLVAHGKDALIRAIQFLLSFTASGLIVYAIIHDSSATTQAMAESATYKWVILVTLAFTFLNLVLAALRTITKKGLALDMLRFILQLVVSLAGCYVSYASALLGGLFLAFMVFAALLSLLQIIIANLQFDYLAKNRVVAAKEDTLAGFEVEQYVEAYEYEGGPVAGVEMAEEVNLTAAQARGDKPDLATLVGNGFDPFLFLLSEEEKKEFVDLYILRSRSLMPEIPAYVVGGDNKDFFNKVFIYLGQYREKISNELLQKMYDFSMKLS